ncbi:MAG: BtpA/SgcQ family protein [Spirochaetia bacterium]
MVGSGVDERNVKSIMAVADGCIVASSLKEDGVWWNSVEPKRARAFIAAMRESGRAV